MKNFIFILFLGITCSFTQITITEGGASTSTNTDGVTGSGNNATVNQYTAKGIKIEWKENPGGQYAYDTQKKTGLPEDKYPSVKDSDNNTVYVPYKATVNKQTELFDAKVSITDPALKDAKIIFKTLSVGNTVDNKIWLSINLDRAKDEVHIFDAISVEGTNGGEWLRITDSEYRMLNKLAENLGAVKGGKYPNINGELKIISENPYCASCTGIIQQFNEMFPNIKLVLVDGAK